MYKVILRLHKFFFKKPSLGRVKFSQKSCFWKNLNHLWTHFPRHSCKFGLLYEHRCNCSTFTKIIYLYFNIVYKLFKELNSWTNIRLLFQSAIFNANANGFHNFYQYQSNLFKARFKLFQKCFQFEVEFSLQFSI